MSQKSFVEQNEHFKVNSAVDNGISLCIPRMFNNIGFNRVKGVFIKHNWGCVERVDVIHYGDHKKAFIHFRPGSWNWNVRNAQILEQLQRGEQIHLRYENGKPWFWHVGVSYVERPKKEDVNYFPTGVMNLKKTTQGDELLKRKHENSKNNVNSMFPSMFPLVVPNQLACAGPLSAREEGQVAKRALEKLAQEESQVQQCWKPRDCLELLTLDEIEQEAYENYKQLQQSRMLEAEEQVRDGDDPIKARMNENSPKARENEIEVLGQYGLASGLVKEDEWRCGQCRVVNKKDKVECIACSYCPTEITSAELYTYDPQTEDTFA